MVDLVNKYIELIVQNKINRINGSEFWYEKYVGV